MSSISEAIQLSRRVSPDQLGIKLNPPARGKLMMARNKPAPAIKIGGMQFSIIGPFPADLTKLRKEWNEWLKNNKEKLTSIEESREGRGRIQRERNRHDHAPEVAAGR